MSNEELEKYNLLLEEFNEYKSKFIFIVRNLFGV
jgi:hypothetical protein